MANNIYKKIILLAFLLWTSDAKAENYSFINEYVGASTSALIWDDKNPKCKKPLAQNKACLNDSRLIQAIRAFFKNQKRSYIYMGHAQEPLADSIITVLGGPPDEVIELKNSYIIAAACRSHGGAEKGMMIYDPATNSIAFAMLHYSLTEVSLTEQRGYITLFLKATAPSSFRENAVSIAKEWREKLVQEYNNPEYSEYSYIDPEFRVEEIP